jgi:hypothetical protein
MQEQDDYADPHPPGPQPWWWVPSDRPTLICVGLLLSFLSFCSCVVTIAHTPATELIGEFVRWVIAFGCAGAACAAFVRAART